MCSKHFPSGFSNFVLFGRMLSSKLSPMGVISLKTFFKFWNHTISCFLCRLQCMWVGRGEQISNYSLHFLCQYFKRWIVNISSRKENLSYWAAIIFSHHSIATQTCFEIVLDFKAILFQCICTYTVHGRVTSIVPTKNKMFVSGCPCSSLEFLGECGYSEHAY